MTCPACGTENRPGAKFCVRCGAVLALRCPECAAPHDEGDAFCAECGTQLVAPESLTDAARPAARTEPSAERRLVSVLFADLVGFTAVSEQRDAEETRELLSRYFDTCRSLIERYGGTVEKFIGDAVMAVWGTPVAQEDDAERAVRTALDLVDAVAVLGAEIGAPGLSARAGVLTGEAAVTLGAAGEGMVAGDLVNTASRIQSAAEPGTVLVGDSTRRASEAAIAYENAGGHELKGKAEPVSLSRALRVTATRGGALKSAGLEPPFVGRERELRLVKELFHASAEERRAQLVSVVGVAGIGKSRLAWEFYKYVDGLAELVRWHRGRCLAYGEGVAYWALAEMVRMRAEIAEGEDPVSALEKLRGSLALHVPDAEERAWSEPRLAHLLGLTERPTAERDDLFAAWRLFFERLGDESPVILVFEDMQWADPSLLDFVEYLLEWSRSHPLYVVALTRPELQEHRPGWGASGRNASTLALEPLSQAAMEELLDGFVPGLPPELRAQILARAEGVPLYAVETIRMLLDRGLLEREGEQYRVSGPVEALDVPETLHALVAARIDGLSVDERRLVQDASVLGKTFSRRALAALNARSEAELEPLLNGLIRKEVLTLQADPRSPERGQYGFVQDLLKRIAYETIARRERKTRHLAAAAYLEQDWGPAEQEIVEVVAAHYLAAYEATPEADDAQELKAKARETLARAGERAASLAAGEEALHYFEQAAELADEATQCAALLERAGQTAWTAGQLETAERHLERALELFEGEGESHAAARVASRLGEVEMTSGRVGEALARMEPAFAALADTELDADVAMLAAELGRLHFFAGDLELASERIETALGAAEALWLPDVLAAALITAGLIASQKGRHEQALALIRHALELALEHELTAPALRAYANLGDQLDRRDRYEDALEQHARALALARRVGNRRLERRVLAETSYCLYEVGRWNEALETVEEIGEEVTQTSSTIGAVMATCMILVARGKPEEAARRLAAWEWLRSSSSLQDRAFHATSQAVVLVGEGRNDEALVAAEQSLAADSSVAATMKMAYVQASEAALASGRLDKLEELLSQIEARRPGELPPFLRAQAARFRAKLAATRGSAEGVELRFKTATGIFREFGMPFWLAVTLLEHGEWLAAQGRSSDAEPQLAEAREIFGSLEATPWLERAEHAARKASAIVGAP